MEELKQAVMKEFCVPLEKSHLGHFVATALRIRPDAINQVDGNTGETESNASVYTRSKALAQAMRSSGVQVGDVVALMAPNHLHIVIPFYACMFNGYTCMPVDHSLSSEELNDIFVKTKPTMIFCQNSSRQALQDLINLIGLKSKIITFDGKSDDSFSFEYLLRKGIDNSEFRVQDVDVDNSNMWLICTSGSTGTPKAAMATFRAVRTHILQSFDSLKPPSNSCFLNLSTLQWLSGLLFFVFTTLSGVPRLQTSRPTTPEHVSELIDKYKPCMASWCPPKLYELLKYNPSLDLSSFAVIGVSGCIVSDELVQLIRSKSQAKILSVYGMSESIGALLLPRYSESFSVWKPIPTYQFKLMDIETGLEVTESNKPGELWVKHLPIFFKGYYNDLEETKKILTDDGWMKTGDLFYKDNTGDFVFIERAKMLLKYQNNQISPLELEERIRAHPGVLDVAVTAISDPNGGDLPLALVVRKNDSINDKHIHDMVKDLADYKRLRGGVKFVDALPKTPSGKVARRKLKYLLS